MSFQRPLRIPNWARPFDGIDENPVCGLVIPNVRQPLGGSE